MPSELLGTGTHCRGLETYGGAEIVCVGLALGEVCEFKHGSINRRLGEGGLSDSLSDVPYVQDEPRFEQVLQG